jgi:hypothetical protein
MLFECGVTFGYRLDLENEDVNHRETIEVAHNRGVTLAECLRLATGRTEREAEALISHGTRKV